MIRPLRRRHRRVITALSVVLPVLYAATLVARRPIPRDPGGTATADASRPELWADTRDLGDSGARLEARLLGPAASPAVALRLSEAPASPDLLAFWSPAAGGVPDALLLGALDADGHGLFELPPAARAGGGRILLYSLGHREVVADVPLPEPP